MRRTDKIVEANYIELSEYMKAVEAYYDKKSEKKTKLVYLSTEVYSVVVEAKMA